MNQIKEYTEKIFEDIKHIDELGNEYWQARELQSILGYNQWRSINDLIERAISACKESKYNIDDHFALYRKMVDIGSKTTRKIIDYKLSRYACYLIVMNGNPQKEIIALGQTYFAIQTRKQELSEKEYNELTVCLFDWYLSPQNNFIVYSNTHSYSEVISFLKKMKENGCLENYLESLYNILGLTRSKYEYDHFMMDSKKFIMQLNK